MCWRETRPGPRQRSTMWSSAGLGWGGWLELGQGREQQPVVGTTALQLSALLCRCVGHVTPHRRTRRAAPGRAAPLHTPATTPLRQFESRRRVERRHRDTCRYCPCLSTGTTAQTAYRYNKKYKVYTHVRSAVGSYTRQYSDHKVCIRSVKVVMRTRDTAAVTV